jgi:ABC-type polysaccharide/polyol phosphate transport system ATPase subunit
LPTSPEGTIEVEDVWKRFRADRSLPEFREHLKHLGRRLRGQPRGDWRWVLRDVSLKVEPGRTQAVVGVNGSGKSTLLKLICQTTFPTAGKVAVAGNIGALLEVRSGIHPDLTGRENIYLYGNILGLTRRQVAERFDDIVDFAELSAAVDRQVKFYSAGMAVRLGFSIAVFLKPSILLVDEVLAVGDAHFQQKCLQRISEVVAEGTTLVFVSHDLATVEAVCERALWLADSYAQAEGPTREVLALYRASVEEQAAMATARPGEMRLAKVEVAGPDGDQVLSGEELLIKLRVQSPEAGFGTFVFGISQGTATPVFVVRNACSFPEGDFELRCRLRHLPLPKGRYSLWAAAWAGRQGAAKPLLPWQPVANFEAFGPMLVAPPPGVMVLSPVHVDSTWELN